MADRTQVALDSITMINQLLDLQNQPTGNLDPIEISKIIEFNMKHLQSEKEKGGFTEEELSIINTKIIDADDYIKKNPINEDGGGGPKPTSPSVVVFQDCKGGFTFALDFSPEIPLLNFNNVYFLNADGYQGCGQAMPKPKKIPKPYLKPTIYSEYKTCEDCKKNL